MSGSKNLLKNTFGVSLATLASRICGLLRVKLEALAIGGGLTATIWFTALLIPNLFRRLLGEGALGTALIPVVAQEERENGIPEVRKVLAQVLCVLGAVLALIVTVVSLGAILLQTDPLGIDSAFLASARVQGVCKLLPLIMPYAFFICLTGVIGAVLNYAGIFVRPALTAVLFNLCMILGLLIGFFSGFSPESLLILLALLTPAAGAVQLLLMLWMLKECGRFPDFCRSAFASFAVTWKVLKLASPGMMAYGVLQISFVIDRTLALYLGDQAVPALTYVDRLIDLPIGLFAVSLGTVLMASMTRAAADKDWQEMNEQLNLSMRHVWFVCSPMAAMVIFFHAEILSVLCLGGRYTGDDLDAARLVAIFYGMGIPLFCSMKVLLPAFYSRQDMKRPFYVSLVAISVNIILNLILMIPLKQGGLALATVCSSCVNNSCLLYLLAKDGFSLRRGTLFSAVRSVMTALIPAIPIWFAVPHFSTLFPATFTAHLLVLTVVAVVYGCGFFLLAWLFKVPELRELFTILRRRKKKSA